MNTSLLMQRSMVQRMKTSRLSPYPSAFFIRTRSNLNAGVTFPLRSLRCYNLPKRHLSTSNKSTTTNNTNKSLWERWTAPREMPPRNTLRWYGEMVLICTVFGITGTSSMVLVRPAMSNVLQLKGSLKDGPWSYRICSLVIMTPLYATLLVLVGTIFGRHAYFRHFAVKMFSRFGIPPELMDSTFHQTKATFRKW